MPNRKNVLIPGGSGLLFFKIPAGFLSDKGIILSLSILGAFGAEGPSKKSAGKDGDEDLTVVDEESPFSCFLFVGKTFDRLATRVKRGASGHAGQMGSEFF